MKKETAEVIVKGISALAMFGAAMEKGHLYDAITTDRTIFTKTCYLCYGWFYTVVVGIGSGMIGDLIVDHVYSKKEKDKAE